MSPQEKSLSYKRGQIGLANLHRHSVFCFNFSTMQRYLKRLDWYWTGFLLNVKTGMLDNLTFRSMKYVNLFNLPANVKNLRMSEKLVILPTLKGDIVYNRFTG